MVNFLKQLLGAFAVARTVSATVATPHLSTDVRGLPGSFGVTQGHVFALQSLPTARVAEIGWFPPIVSSRPPSVVALPCCAATHARCKWVKVAPFTIPECDKQNLLSLLRWVSSVLHGVDWWLTAGTMLGSVRNEAHIEHETDVDLAVKEADWSEVVKQLKAKVGETHFKLDATSSIPRLFFSSKNQVHIDFWRVSCSDTHCADIAPVTGKGLINFQVDMRMLFPLATCVYEGGKYPCPRHSLHYVKLRYGDGWQTPKPKYNLHPTYHDGDGFDKDAFKVFDAPAAFDAESKAV